MADSEGPLDARELPAWFADAKFGVMVHWTPSSVPGFAPNLGRIWDLPDPFKNSPYTEWYANSLRIEGSPVAEYHATTYGLETPYESFGPEFRRTSMDWHPQEWADLFQRAGAKYVVPVTKHHDGFLLWPSAVESRHAPPDWRTARDVVGELGEAVRARAMRYGLYYSGGLDWTFNATPIRSFAGFRSAIPREAEYVDYAFAQWKELIERYEPACLWNDIFMPGPRERLEGLFRSYFERVPDGVVNDRWKSQATPEGMRVTSYHDFTTPEFEVAPDIREKKWECVRGIGHSFGYNRVEQDEDYASAEELIRLLVDIVSKNGNLLLNVGPRSDGSIPAPQVDRLERIGAWLATNGEAIYGTRPWVRAEGTTTDGTPVRFTHGRDTLYAHVLGPLGVEVRLPGVQPRDSAAVRVLGRPGALSWCVEGGSLVVSVPPGAPVHPAAAVLAIAIG
jgi:alpha-L-fucosidase